MTTILNTQTRRPMAVTTPLGPDRLLLVGFSGQEGLSQLFTFDLAVLAENRTEVPFDKLLGQPVSVRLELPGGKQQRYFSGVCSRVTQGESTHQLTDYRLEMVPAFWLLTRRAQSRIFQHKNVPDILKEVLQGLDPALRLPGSWHPRDYCVQYRETDFAFASRLMEEEGIYYFFQHGEKGHRLVLANTPQSHPDLAPGSKLVYRNRSPGDILPEDVIYDWTKSQELAASKYTLRDHCFELPHSHLEAQKPMLDSVPVGRVSHKLKLSGNGKLEVYDWPGAYAQRFDGVDRGGAERPAELRKIYEDNQRTAAIRMEQGAAASLVLRGAGTCRQLVSGHRFTLATLSADALTKPQKAEGAYVLTAVAHSARQGGYRSNEGIGFEYSNRFTCIPAALPFRPPRVTPRPVIQGTQTALVVGLADEEVFTDKYGRVKVKFHWDRDPKKDADSSCWVRVAQHWAGKGWGAHFWPRVNHEVVVAFEEGDPDRPIIVGSVYNAENVPPYPLPEHQTRSGVKTRSTPKGTEEHFNELRFEDKKGREEIYLHAERELNTVVEGSESRSVGGDRTTVVHKNEKLTVEESESRTIGGNRTTTVRKHEKLTVDEQGRETTIRHGTDVLFVEDGDRETHVAKGDDLLQVDAGDARRWVKLGNDLLEVKAGNAERMVPGGKYQVVAKEVMVVGYEKITLQVAGSTLTIEPKGITLTAPEIQSVAVGVHDIKGLPVKINC